MARYLRVWENTQDEYDVKLDKLKSKKEENVNKETLEQYLARGGTIAKCKPKKGHK